MNHARTHSSNQRSVMTMYPLCPLFSPHEFSTLKRVGLSVFSSRCAPEITIACVIDDSFVSNLCALVIPSVMLNASCAQRESCVMRANHTAHLVSDVIEVHDTDPIGRVRRLAHVTAKEYRVASLDGLKNERYIKSERSTPGSTHPHNGSLEVIALRVDI